MILRGDNNPDTGGKLNSADGELNLLKEQYFPVISIEMQKSGQAKGHERKINYTVDSIKQKIKVKDFDSTCEISMSRFKEEAKLFFTIISSRKGKSFSVPEANSILTDLGNPKTKQSSDSKADIHIVIHDIMTGFENEVGFSIKSKHSKPATLINASGQTLFQYKVLDTQGHGKPALRTALSPYSNDGNKVGPKARVQNLINAGYTLKFECVKKSEFRENLQLIDSMMDCFLADCLIVFMKGSKASLADIVNEVAIRNPCQFKTVTSDRLLDFYEYKIKRLLTDTALGMQPKSRWEGTYDASGGYIVVKEQGDVVCYHLFNWNALQNYLYNNMRFETPSSTCTKSKASFNYALYYDIKNEDYMDICLQLRFK